VRLDGQTGAAGGGIALQLGRGRGQNADFTGDPRLEHAMTERKIRSLLQFKQNFSSLTKNIQAFYAMIFLLKY
jgi:hypothetical protein